MFSNTPFSKKTSCPATDEQRISAVSENMFLSRLSVYHTCKYFA